MSVWVRCLLLLAILVEVNYRVEYGGAGQILNSLYVAAQLAVSGIFLYVIESRRIARPGWMLGLSAWDVTAIGFSTALSGGLDSNYWVLYYPTLAMFAAVFTSMKLTLAWTTIVASTCVALSFTVGDGVDIGAQEEKTLLYRLLGLYAVGVAVNLITRFERIRRREAVEREIQRERVETSQRIHDTAAQSAYLVGMGIDGALELARESDEALRERLKTTQKYAKSAMWELRQPIEVGAIFEGRTLTDVLISHAEVYTGITSVPVEVSRSGSEPFLPATARALLFSIAHNALTNVSRHAGADMIEISLEFDQHSLVMRIHDDGVGLPSDYADRGNGFRNMAADAERLGGRLDVESDRSRGGTKVTCVLPMGVSR